MLTKQNKKPSFDIAVSLFKENKVARYIVYTAGGLAVLYLLGKSFSIVAGAVRGYKDLKSAIRL